MEFRGHNDDSDGDDFLPHHRRLGLGRLYQDGELGNMAPSSSAATPSLNFNQSGFFASGSAFRRPPIFPSPLSSTAQLPPSATPPSPHRQPPLSHQPQPLLISQGGGRGSALVDGDISQKPALAVQLPSSLDPNLTLVQDRTQEQQQLLLREARKDHRDAASPRSFPATDGAPPAEGGGGLPSSSKTDAAAAPVTTSRARPSRAVASGNTGASARYRECLKNHAARVGGHVLDGCGEFMPGGEDGTSEALKCAACTCHRSFHRKEVEGGEESEGLFVPVSSASPSRSVQHGDPRRYYVPDMGAGNGSYPGGVARGGGLSSGGARNLHNPSPLSLQTPSNRGRQREHPREGLLPPSLGGAFAPPRSGGTAFGGGGGGNDDDENTNYSGGTTTTESSSEGMQAHMLAVAATSFHHGAPPAPVLQTPPPAGAGVSQQQHAHYQVAGVSRWTKKRFRSKFTAEQKEMMTEFAERVGWRMQKQDDAAVEEFCREAGVSRRVFKVWMHNNKHALLKSKPQPPPPPPPPPPQQGVPQPQPQPLPQPQQSSSSS